MKLSTAIMIFGGVGMGVFLASIDAHHFWLLPGGAAVGALAIFFARREDKQ